MNARLISDNYPSFFECLQFKIFPTFILKKNHKEWNFNTCFPSNVLSSLNLFNLKPIFIQYLSGTIKKKKKKKKKAKKSQQTIEPRSTLNNVQFLHKPLFQQSRKRKQNVAQTCQATEFSLASFEQPLAPQEEWI